MAAKFKVGDKVFVPAAQYSGEVIEVRGDGETAEFNVRYSVPNGRRPHYETWWPAANVIKAAA